MKPENTIENKAAFFALYWGQEVITSDNHTAHGLKPLPVCGAIMREIDSYQYPYLLLKSLLSISDEDVIEVAYLHWPDKRGSDVNTLWTKKIVDTISQFQPVLDFLRSRGYALPWKGLSVDDLVEYGWVKLQEVGL